MSYAFLLLEIIAFGYLIRLQCKNWAGAQDALINIDQILTKPIFINTINVSQILLDQLDQYTELPLDKIRSYANAALVTGIGGTMALFAIEAIPIGVSIISSSGSGSIQLPPWHTIFIGLILALFSSLIGVIFHLRITSKIFSRAHEAVSTKETELLDVQASAIQDSPNNELSIQLEELTKAWSEAEAADLFEMIPRFLEGQMKVMQQMQDRFEKEQSTALKAIQSQEDLTHKIDGIFEEINQTFEVQKEISTKILEGVNGQLTTVSGFLEKLIQERESLTTEIESLPKNIKNSLDVETMTNQFSHRSQRYVDEMGREFLLTIEKLQSDIGNHQRKLSTKIESANIEMRGFFDQLKTDLITRVVQPFGQVSEQLKETTNAMPKFGDDLLRSVDAISGIPEKLEQTGNNITDVVRSTATEVLTPVATQMNQYIKTVDQTHERLEEIIHGLVKLIRDMVEELEGKTP